MDESDELHAGGDSSSAIRGDAPVHGDAPVRGDSHASGDAPAYLEIRPSARLASHVHCFWFLRHAALEPGAVQRIVPDGRPETVFHFGDSFRESSAAAVGLQPAALVAGQLTRPIEVEPTGRVEVVGIRWRPCGASAFLALPLSELADRTAPLAEAADGAWRGLVGRLEEATGWRERTRVLEEFLTARAPAAAPDQAVDAAVELIERSRGRLPVGEVARRVGSGSRRLERGFARHVGIGPKLLSRLVRFRSVTRAMRQGPPPSWSAAALEAGYFDQAHLIRDFRAFAGDPPAAFLAVGHKLAALFAGTPPDAASPVPAGDRVSLRPGRSAR